MQVCRTLEENLLELSRNCDIGAKKNSKGHMSWWVGYKLHIDTVDGDMPATAVLTSASLHDSQTAVLLIQWTTKQVTYLYELADSAYDAECQSPPSWDHLNSNAPPTWDQPSARAWDQAKGAKPGCHGATRDLAMSNPWRFRGMVGSCVNDRREARESSEKQGYMSTIAEKIGNLARGAETRPNPPNGRSHA